MKKADTHKILNVLQIILFSIFITYIMLRTFPKIITNSIDAVLKANINTAADTFEGIQTSFKETLIYKNEFTSIASLADSAMSRIFADNYNYLKDENGVLHKVDNHNLKIEFPSDILGLHLYAKNRNIDIPFVYVQNPLRVDLPSSYNLYDTSMMDELAQRSYDMLTPDGIDFFRVSDECTTYFKTDMHADTASQAAAMLELVNHLEATYGLSFPNKELLNVTDTNLYSKIEYPFVGGYSRSIGKYFTDMDNFDIYIPNFETSITVELLDFGAGSTGPLDQMLIRIPDTITDYTYWITNMAYYGHSMYKITNNLNPDGPKLIVVMDSSALSGLCYLPLTCSEILVFDPRFSTDIKYANKVQACLGDYDAIIFDTLNNCSDEFSIHEPVYLHVELQRHDENAIRYYIDIFDDRATNGNFDFIIDHDSEFVSMHGWAYDMINQLGFGHIYLKIDNEIIKCNYGVDTIGAFGNEHLDHVGFNVQIPMEMFKNTTGTIELICEGYENTWYYTPLTFSYTKTY